MIRVLLFLLAALPFFLGTPALAYMNLSPWVVSDASDYYADTGGTYLPSDWDILPGNETAVLRNNHSLTTLQYEATPDYYTATGRFSVGGGSDDDFVGFVFGFEDWGHTYVFDWKGGDQGGALAGMSIRKIHATDQDHAYGFWNNGQGNDSFTLLAQNLGDGWQHGSLYYYTLEFGPTGFNLDVGREGDGELWSTDVADTDYSGNFGLYNSSQQDAHYSDIDIVPRPTTVPEPGTVALLGVGLLGLIAPGYRRLRK